jgi:3-methyladenine DNA glycosylase Mpg
LVIDVFLPFFIFVTENPKRSEAIRLREQQDLEYQESIEEERRQHAEEEAKAAAEEAKRQAEELAAAVELSKQLSRKDEMRKLKAVFESKPEPPAAPDVSTIRFQLPRGKKPNYRFYKTDKAQVSREEEFLSFFSFLFYICREYLTIFEYISLMKVI